jgi:hypothetical protein
MNGEKLSRETIIKTLVDAVEPLKFVQAFWEGGAAAFGRVDKWSDIDLYLVVDDKKAEDTFLVVESVLESLSPIERKYVPPSLHGPGVYQAFYRLKEVSEYLLIDLAILQRSCPDKFLEPQIHGKVVFHFNKSDQINIPTLNKDALLKRLGERLERLKARVDLFNNYVPKEINRSNYLEAFDYYFRITLSTLTEILRMKYNPFHHDFVMRYVHYELPSNIIEKLMHLYFVKDENDLQNKYQEATDWLREIIAGIDEKQIWRVVGIA